MKLPHSLKALFASILMLLLVACAPTKTSEGTGEYIDDALITTKVKAALAADSETKATEIKVETFKGIVQLSGFVRSPESKRRAITVARGVKGVREVRDDMALK